MSSERYEPAVIGGGPAGCAAATWLARYRWVDRAHGYLGRDPLNPGPSSKACAGTWASTATSIWPSAGPVGIETPVQQLSRSLLHRGTVAGVACATSLVPEPAAR